MDHADLPSYTAEQIRQRHLHALDQAATSGRVPPLLLRRWEEAMEEEALWRFTPVPVHGDLHEDNLLLERGRVVGVTGWTDLHVGDPAGDVAWLAAATDPDLADRVLDAYAARRADAGAAALSDADTGLFVAAVANANWHATHRFCAFCGGVTDVEAAGWVRRCRDCSREQFPRTDPAVIVAVIDPAGRILLGRNAAWPEGLYSCLAGFVEPGESLEHAVVREIAEESGVTVTQPRYRGSQPWPFPRSLMLGFTALAPAGAEPVPDGEEILSVRWFEREELAHLAREGDVTLPGAVSIARALIEDWYGGMLPDAQTLIT